MRLTRRTLLASAAAAATIPLFSHPIFAAGPTGTLTIGLSAFPSNFDPFMDVGAAAAFVQQTLHRGLLGYAPDGTMRGELAESWSNIDANTWEFVLRDAKFSNGAPVTPADVQWTIEHLSADDSTAVMKTQMQQIASVEIVDDKTLRVITSEPVAVLPLWFANYYLPILPANTEDVTMSPGAGPFVFAGSERGQSIQVSASEHFYRDDMPSLEAISFIVYSDENLRVAALQSGDVDLVDFVPWQSMGAVESDPNFKLAITEGPFMFLLFNYNVEPFNDPRVRRAIALAVRRQEVIDAAFYGRGLLLDGFPVALGTAFENPDYAHSWAYDQEEAKALLAEAGFPDGFACKLLSTSQYSMHQNTALVVQQHLGEIGIEVELVLPDWATRGELGSTGQYEMAVQGTSWRNSDPESWAVLFDGSGGDSVVRSFGMRNERISELFVAGQSEFDETARKAIYDEIQKLVVEETPVVPLLWRSQGFGLKASIEGFAMMPGPLNGYSGTTLETTTAP